MYLKHIIFDIGFRVKQLPLKYIDAYNKSVVTQLVHSYGYINKYGNNNTTMTITDINDNIGSYLLDNHPNWNNINFSKHNLQNLIKYNNYNKNKLIYLSPDSPNILNRIHNDNIYILGGIADRSVEKFMTLNRANNLGIQHARLPIKEYIPSGLQKYALNIETVVKIILDLSSYQQNNDQINHHQIWNDILYKHIPSRYINRRSNIKRKKRFRAVNNEYKK